MKRREGYKGYVIVARSCELREGEFSAEFSVEEHEPNGVMETEFYLPATFPTHELRRLRQQFKPEGSRLMWGLRGGVRW